MVSASADAGPSTAIAPGSSLGESEEAIDHVEIAAKTAATGSDTQSGQCHGKMSVCQPAAATGAVLAATGTGAGGRFAGRGDGTGAAGAAPALGTGVPAGGGSGVSWTGSAVCAGGVTGVCCGTSGDTGPAEAATAPAQAASAGSTGAKVGFGFGCQSGGGITWTMLSHLGQQRIAPMAASFRTAKRRWHVGHSMVKRYSSTVPQQAREKRLHCRRRHAPPTFPNSRARPRIPASAGHRFPDDCNAFRCQVATKKHRRGE